MTENVEERHVNAFPATAGKAGMGWVGPSPTWTRLEEGPPGFTRLAETQKPETLNAGVRPFLPPGRDRPMLDTRRPLV